MTQVLSPITRRDVLAVVVYKDQRSRLYFVRCQGEKFNAALHQAELKKAGFSSELLFGDTLLVDLAGKEYFDAVKHKTIHSYVCVNVRTPSDEHFERRKL
jgi:hypothetical protein